MNFFPTSMLLQFLVVTAIPASAGMMNPMSIEELSTNADVIVHGTVLSKSVQRDPEGRIYTRVRLQVDEVWKGKINPEEFVVVHGGGRIGNEQSRASIQVSYGIGEEVVAMLRLNQRHEGVTVGLVQGKFHISTEPSTGQKFARNPFHGRSENGPSTKLNSPQGQSRLTLAELRHRAQPGGKL